MRESWHMRDYPFIISHWTTAREIFKQNPFLYSYPAIAGIIIMLG